MHSQSTPKYKRAVSQRKSIKVKYTASQHISIKEKYAATQRISIKRKIYSQSMHNYKREIYSQSTHSMKEKYTVSQITAKLEFLLYIFRQTKISKTSKILPSTSEQLVP